MMQHRSILRLFVAATIALASSISISADDSLQRQTQQQTSKAPSCGSILTKDGNDLTLGPYQVPSSERTAQNFECNTGTGQWFAHSYYNPMYLYAFQLTQKCEYQFRTPEGKLEWETVRDVNSWFEQAAKTFQRPDNVGYKASDDDIGFSGLAVPNYETDLITENIQNCPEDYCVKVIGPSITYQSLGSRYYNTERRHLADTEAPELLYAFSNEDAQVTFYKMMRNAMRSSNSQHIFLTNHFLRCGCESFCVDEDTRTDDSVAVEATCYVEELCGERVFQVSYSEDYPDERKATWASTGTTQVMEWFNECANAMFSCTEHKDSDRKAFRGTNNNAHYNGFSRVFEYDSWKGASFVYGLGGDKYDGFPDSVTTEEPLVAWSCPTSSHQSELHRFGDYVASTQFFRDAGLETSVPAQQNPCAPEIFNPPDPPQIPPPIGPNCEDVDHIGYCYQMPGATCYATRAAETCAEVDLVMVNETSRYVYGDVADWADACLASGTNCGKDARHSEDHGTLLYNGLPQAIPFYIDNDRYEWYFMLSNLRRNGTDTVDGAIYYNCDTWENAFGAQNFTNSAGDLYSVFGNTYGDLWTVREEACTPSPTDSTIESSQKPTVTLTESPSASPTPDPMSPECYTGPTLLQKDSNTIEMCDYNDDMVQINHMNKTEVTLTINNVWPQNELPEQLRVFSHANSLKTIIEDGDFQCLNVEGSDIDFEGENEFIVECYQESPDDPWLAVIDIVITDELIGTTNTVGHPCFSGAESILESCSWRVIIPCTADALCPEHPSSSSLSPTPLPTTSRNTNDSVPAETPVTSPTEDSSATPTVAFMPTTAAPFGDNGFAFANLYPNIGPKECPEDVLLVQHKGDTEYPEDAVQIVRQDGDSVTVKLAQTLTNSSLSVDNIFYQYKLNHFHKICFEEQNLYGEDFTEITIQCTANSHIAILEFWVADDITKNILSEADNATIPDCCYPSIPDGTPVTNFLVEIKCVTDCPQVVG